MKIDILTLFPEMFAPLEHSIVGKAREKGLLDISYHNFRDYAEKARHVDDEPYGGGQGMLLQAQPIFDCIEAIGTKQPRVILLDPAGKRFDQALAEEFAQEEELIFICGHYEGYDERIKTLVTDEVSLGDFVLTGGELAAMTMVDATVRLIPEVIGKESSHQDDSFSSGLLEYPQYTRPYDFRGMVVPDVLMGGHHEKIRLWRLEQSLKKTLERRPDLLETYQLSAEEDKLLRRIKATQGLRLALYDKDSHLPALMAYGLDDETYTAHPKDLLALMEEDPERYGVLVFNDSQGLVGFFSLDFGKGLETYGIDADNCGLIGDFSIADSYRRQGIAQTCFDRILELLADLPLPELDRLVLAVNEKNKPARTLYRQAGFEVIKKGVPGEKGRLMLMEKRR